MKKVTFAGHCLLAALLCGVSSAQMNHRAWTTENGLPQNSVHDILQTRDGFLWFATEKGIARFDGFDFVSYSRENSPELGNDDVRTLSEEASGLLSLTTAEGTFVLDRGHFSKIKEMQSQPSKEVRIGEAPAWTYQDDTVVRRNPDGTISKWKVLLRGDNNRIQAILLDPQDTLWIGTRHGLFRLEKDKVSPVADLSSDSILCLFEDREGDLWIGTSSTGLHLLSPRSIEVVPEFANHGITTVAASSDGDLWAGTPEDGLFHSHQGHVRNITAKQGLNSDFVLSIASASGADTWVGSPNGLNRLRQGRIVSSLRLENGLPDDFVRSILANRDGSVFIGTRHGLASWNKNQITLMENTGNTSSDLVGALARTSNGDLWVGTLHGVSRFRQSSVDNFLPRVAVTSLIEDQQGRLWLGTTASGLYLWEGSNFGRVEAVSIPQKIFGLIDDTFGYLWIRTDSGLGRLSLDSAVACALRKACGDVHVRIFNTGDGLPSNDLFEVGQPGQARDKDGNLYFATRRGLARINPNNIQSNMVAPVPVVTGVTVDNRDRIVRPEQILTLEPYERRVTISYVAPSLRQPAKVRYRYRLEGFDRDWLDAGTNRSVSYTNLPLGNHRFLVMASNEDGVWSKTPAQLEIFVNPPIYRRWWFYLLIALAGAGLFLLFYWLRERKLRQQFAAVLAERGRIAREVHDTLAQDLVGVSVQLELVTSLLKGGQSQAAADQLEDTKAVVREGLSDARQSIWDLRATADEKTFPVRAKLTSEQAAGRPDAVHFEITGAYHPFPDRMETELLRILKEAVRNSVRHSGSMQVNVSLQYLADSLAILIKDDGVGFDLSGPVPAGHFGVQGMRERAKAIGIILTIESAVGKGTSIGLRASV